MMNYIVIVVLTSLTIAQGSPSFEEVLEQINELYNEGINVRAESKDSVHLTDDSTNLQEKDTLDAISDTSKPYNAWENIIVPINGHTDLMNSMKNDRPFTVNSEFKFPHPVDDKGNIADIIVTVAKHGGHDNSFEYFVPKLLSIEQDLMGSVQCQNLICNINLLGCK
ncbi:hypothetical protein ACJMK2_001964 [Sinanodonta woodiana]|uniref:Uncharacterized protein n=1 Tax=Sinanodonta woodiana TaxID=1069815 RepID=A0ABD3XXB6_SINWO